MGVFDSGMGGLTVPVVFEGLPLDLTAMYFELDGSFPNHEANPIEPENLRDLQRKVLYAGSGVNYSDPPSATSDAILAFQMEGGRLLWSRQLRPADVVISRIPVGL